MNDLRVLRCQTCNNDTIIAARFHGQWATYTSIMARADREGLCEVPFYANLDRVALELLKPGLAPTQRATIFWRRANDGRSEAAGFSALSVPGDQFEARDACEMDAPARGALRAAGVPRAGHRDGAAPDSSSTPCREAKHVAIEGVTDEGLRLLARAVPADQRSVPGVPGDEFVRSLRLALERRDRVANYVKRLERQRDRAARKRGRRRSSRGRTPRPAAAAGLCSSPTVAAASRSRGASRRLQRLRYAPRRGAGRRRRPRAARGGPVIVPGLQQGEIGQGRSALVGPARQRDVAAQKEDE